jgi:hypothetical protein
MQTVGRAGIAIGVFPPEASEKPRLAAADRRADSYMRRTRDDALESRARGSSRNDDDRILRPPGVAIETSENGHSREARLVGERRQVAWVVGEHPVREDRVCAALEMQSLTLFEHRRRRIKPPDHGDLCVSDLPQRWLCRVGLTC